MTLAEIEASLYDTLGFKSLPETPVVNRLRRYINQGYRVVMAKKGIGSRLRRQLLTFTTVANTPWAVLPQAATKVFYVSDRTNNRLLTQVSLGYERARDPNLAFSTATLYGYVPYNLASPVAQDPDVAGQLTVVSTDASDVGVAYIQGVRTGGYPFSQSVTMGGTTPTAIGPTDTIAVQKFYLSSVAVGDITLKDAGSNTLSVIPIGRTKARYTRLHMVDKPSSAVVLTVDAELFIYDLANPTDEPIFHEDFHDILEHYACGQEYKKRDKASLYGIEMTESKQRIAELRDWMWRPSGSDGERHPMPMSQLGPYFPAGT
jgi:hypothetical protein